MSNASVIKLQAGQWYRDREGDIWYCVGKKAPAVKSDLGLFVAENQFLKCDFFHDDGRYSDPNEKIRDLIEHLPECTGFDWTPPEPLPAYRAFAESCEFGPYSDRLVRSKDDATGGSTILSFDFNSINLLGFGALSYAYLFEHFVFVDRATGKTSPCGVPVREDA